MSRPVWGDVEAELLRLATTGERFETIFADTNKISGYEPGRRLRLENQRGTNVVDIESIQACWATLERLGTIRRRDVLEPGRCSAFMMALFARIPGVQVEHRDEPYLVLAKNGVRASRPT